MQVETMKTAVFRGVRDIVLEECPKPHAIGSDVLIKVESCALCTWEQRVYTGMNKVEYPFIGGHEVSGTIEEIGEHVDSREWKIGDHVVIGANLSCDECFLCKTGEGQSCPHFDHQTKLEGLPYHGMGGLSEYLLVPTHCVFKYHDVSSQEAAIIEPLSCVVHSVESADIQFGDYVLIIGCGIMGQLHIQLAGKRGASVIAADIDEKRLKLASQLGANHTIDPSNEDLAQKVLEYTDGRKAQVVFDTTPFPSVLEDAYRCVGNTGAVILYSSIHPKPGEDRLVPIDAGWMHSCSIRTIGTANSNARDFVRAATLVSEGIVDMRPFVSAQYTADHVKDAFEKAIEGTSFRVVVNFNVM
ncbi:Alcohol dehydrogenase zinc-binding domain protein [Coriobacterium glomerans PW2]|uniref:Alcohol dehydrogenase zinc-binding domain protein n=1 Tax=Coriobacterium glomerans (strain ATCC 49209 / DSM 20642 / JCM 10262 / PW2) TaxID=700015 RepID=F2N7V5_CORGP|nr:alcohol dehydrogenase catalytic domain-containing protein [Coriobacterium glomerans]AEB07064.1 Alcohol dehydrogenase zinc-binding domain protein [Coriobacterium glomerans PW2]